LTANQGDAVQQALRPYATAGVALVGAGLIAITPMAPRLPDTFTVQDIKLVSGEDTLPDIAAPWIDQFNTASADATQLLNNFFLAPGVGLQQMIANDAGYLQDFFNDPTSSTVASISSEMQENLAAVLTGYTLQGATDDVQTAVEYHSLASGDTSGTSPLILFSEIPNFLPSSVNPAEVTPILDFLGSPLSGIIMGDLGPLISPLVELSNCITAGDDFNTTLADVTGAFFNGATLNLDSLIPLIEQSGYLPFNLENLDITFGGLLSPGTVAAGPYNDSISAVGGSIFNSIGITANGVPVIGAIDLPGYGVGPLGALEGWAETVAGLLGAPGWNDFGPSDVTAPLTGVTLPIIPDDFLDGSTIPAAAAADLSSLVQDVISGLSL
jgi:hypothetical protein